jgi:hypothetical protein
LNEQKQNEKPKIVRIENFTGDDWERSLVERLRPHYLEVRTVWRKPNAIIIALYLRNTWNDEDESRLGSLKLANYFQRWEILEDMPPKPKRNAATLEDIGYKVGEAERLTLKQQETLFSQLQDLELRVEIAEAEAKYYRTEAEVNGERLDKLIPEYNQLSQVLQEELRIEVYSKSEDWIAEDMATGQILARDASVPVLYRKVLRMRIDK